MIPSRMQEFEQENAALHTPYSFVQPRPAVTRLVKWMKDLRSAFDMMDPMRLSTEHWLRMAQPRGMTQADPARNEVPSLLSVMANGNTAETVSTDGPSMAEKLRDWREAFTVQDAMQWCRSSEPAYSFASFGCGALIGLMGTLRTRMWRPKFGVEIEPHKAEMWRDLTGTPCLKDVSELKAALLPWVYMVCITMPCIDFSSSGRHEGDQGSTGWLWEVAVDVAIRMQPMIVFSEMADYAPKVHNGREVAHIVNKLQEHYVVYARIVPVWGYGDGSHRKRLLLIAVHKSLPTAGAYQLPAPVFSATTTHCARDTAQPDAEVPSDHWLPITKFVAQYDWEQPKAGKLHRIARVGWGMGHSSCPNLIMSWDGTNNGPTTYGGGGTKPPLDWVWKPGADPSTMGRRRRTTVKEFYAIASLSMTMLSFHMLYQLGTDVVAYLRDCVNQGWPAASAYHVDKSLAAAMQQAAQSMDMTGQRWELREGVVTQVLRPSSWAAWERMVSGLQKANTDNTYVLRTTTGVLARCRWLGVTPGGEVAVVCHGAAFPVGLLAAQLARLGWEPTAKTDMACVRELPWTGTFVADSTPEGEFCRLLCDCLRTSDIDDAWNPTRKVSGRNLAVAGAHASRKPSEDDSMCVLRAQQTRDWSKPLHPNPSKSSRQELTQPLSKGEWAQMLFVLCMLNELELERGTTLAYAMGVRHFREFLTRYPLESAFGTRHRATAEVFEPAVWGPSEVEQILIDFVLHEVAVRGNGWSSVRGKLFAIRHANVRAMVGNPLHNKFRLKQVMRAVKKYRGPKPGRNL